MSPIEKWQHGLRAIFDGPTEGKVEWLRTQARNAAPDGLDDAAYTALLAEACGDAIEVLQAEVTGTGDSNAGALREQLDAHMAAKPSKKDKNAKKALRNWDKRKKKLEGELQKFQNRDDKLEARADKTRQLLAWLTQDSSADEG